MNKDLSRKLIAIVSSSKRGTSEFTSQDFISNLSFKRSLLPPDVVEEFLKKASEEGLLINKDNHYTPNFSTSGIIVPLDFSVTEEELFSESLERPLVDRLLEAASASGKLTKKEAISRSRAILDHLKLINFEIALMAILADEGIDIDGFLKELEKSSKAA